MLKSSKSNAYVILFPIAFGLLLYSCLRAYYLSFTCDESYSYMEFVCANSWLPHQFDTMSANNHLLNTWAMKICASIFGNSEFSLRVPNILGHVLFLFYSAKMLVDFQSKIVIVCAFLIVNLNPYVLDFFSVARGYGLSMGLLMGSLYYVYEYFSNERKLIYAVLSLVFSSIAVLANFTLLNYFTVLTLLLLLAELITEKRIVIKRNFILVIIPIILFIFIASILLNLIKAGCFYVQTFGNAKGFWEDTVNSLIINSAYESSNILLNPIIKAFVILVLIIGSTVVLKYLFSILKFPGNKNDLSKEIHGYNAFILFLWGALILCFISSILQFKLFGTNYSIGRTALFYVPLFNLLLIFLLNKLMKNSPKFIFLPIAIAVLFLTHFFNCMNIRYCLEYQTDKDVKNAMALLEAYHKQYLPSNNTITLGTGTKSERALNHYRVVKKLDWLQPVKLEELYTREHDFYFLTPATLSNLKMDSTYIIKSFSDDRLLVNKRKNRGAKEFYSKTIHCETARGIGDLSPFSDGFTYTITDSLLKLNKNVLVTFKSSIYMEGAEANAKLVISFEKKGNSYSWKSKDLYFEIPPKKWITVCFPVLIPIEAKPNDIIKAYIWNPGKINVFIDAMEFKLEEYPF